MATYSELAPIELRRLAELEKQAAMHGPQTEPAVLIEIQELRHKHGLGPDRRALDGRRRSDLEYDFLMSTVAAALQRLTAIEARMAGDDADRARRQRVMDTALGALGALVLVQIAIGVLMRVWR